MTRDADRRDELARFLRSRRMRIYPPDLGLPLGSRRRTIGLRREEAAILAGVSPTWYSYLEQGRDVTPSHEVLDSLARVLRMSEDERRYVHLLVHGQAPAAAPDSQSHDPVLLQRIISVAGAGPYPVYAANWLCDLLAWNDAATEWYADFGACAPEDRNMLWWMLTDPVAKERFVDWEAETRDLIARFRAVSIWRQGDQRLGPLLDKLDSTGPEFRKWWQLQEVHGQQPRPRGLCHPTMGIRTFDIAVLYPSGQDEQMIVLHPPCTDDDALTSGITE